MYGITLHLKIGHITSTFIELSGNIMLKLHSKERKDDETKMVKAMIPMLKYSKLVLGVEKPFSQFYAHFSVNYIHKYKLISIY